MVVLRSSSINSAASRSASVLSWRADEEYVPFSPGMRSSVSTSSVSVAIHSPPTALCERPMQVGAMLVGRKLASMAWYAILTEVRGWGALPMVVAGTT